MTVTALAQGVVGRVLEKMLSDVCLKQSVKTLMWRWAAVNYRN